MSPGQSPQGSPQASPRTSPTPSEAEGPSRRRRREDNSNVRPSEGAPPENSNAEDDSNRTLFQQFLQWRSGFFGDGPTSPSAPGNQVKVVLDSKYFQRIKVFDMDRTKYQAWLFDVVTQIGQIEPKLAHDMRSICSRELDENWNPNSATYLDRPTYLKYREELYSCLSSLTDGEAKNVLRAVLEKGGTQDGYKALADLNKRFNPKTPASLLHAYLGVVNPPQITDPRNVVKGVNNWEMRVANLRTRYSEEIKGNLKLAILISILPKEYQDQVMQNSTQMKDLSYEANRDYVLQLVTQRAQLSEPAPMDIGNVGDQYPGWGHDGVNWFQSDPHNPVESPESGLYGALCPEESNDHHSLEWGSYDVNWLGKGGKGGKGFKGKGKGYGNSKGCAKGNGVKGGKGRFQ